MSGNRVDINIEAIVQQVARFTDEGIEAVAKEAVKRAKAATSFTDKTGKLRKSIKAQKSKRKKEGESVWLARATAPHAHLIEYGHAAVTPGGDLTGHVPAHPFMQPAVDSVMPDAEQIAAEHLRKMKIKA